MSIDNDFDKLIRQFQGADYFEYEPRQEETKWRLIYGLVPIALAIAIPFGGAVYCLVRAIMAVAG